MAKTMKTAGETATTATNLDNLVEDVKIAEELVSETICEYTSLDVWRDVEGFEGRYEVSLWGYIRFADRPDKRNVKCRQNGNYLTASLYHKGNTKSTYAKVHMLVANAFVPNPEGYTYVRHKNGKLLDNRADNLEWVETEPKKRKRRKSKRTSKTVYVSPILEVSDGDVFDGDVFEGDVAYPHMKEDPATALMRCRRYIQGGATVMPITYGLTTSDSKYQYRCTIGYDPMQTTPSLVKCDWHYYNTSGTDTTGTADTIEVKANSSNIIQLLTKPNNQKHAQCSGIRAVYIISCEHLPNGD